MSVSSVRNIHSTEKINNPSDLPPSSSSSASNSIGKSNKYIPRPPVKDTVSLGVNTRDFYDDTIEKEKNRGSYLQEFLAETLGTFLLVLLGDGAVAQVVLGKAARQDEFFGGFLNISVGYGLALMVGICVSGGVSGGHLNPAVTLAMAALGKVKAIKVPVYWAGQYLGAFIASIVVWAVYYDAISMVETQVSAVNSYSTATRGIFSSYPFFGTDKVGFLSLGVDQVVGTAILVIIIVSVTDDKNMKIKSSMVPLLIGLGLTAIHLSFGLNSGAAINPARDFSPRLLSFIAGWNSAFEVSCGSNVNCFEYWFLIPWLLPHFGGVAGAMVYKFMVGIHLQ